MCSWWAHYRTLLTHYERVSAHYQHAVGATLRRVQGMQLPKDAHRHISNSVKARGVFLDATITHAYDTWRQRLPQRHP